MALNRLIHIPFTASGNGSGKQTISLPTGAGTPVGAMFIVAATDADDAEDNHDRLSIGFADGTRQRVTTGWSQELISGNPQTARFTNASHVIHVRDMVGGNDDFARMDTTPFSTDAVNIEWNGGTDPSFSYKGMLVAVVGDDADCEVNNDASSSTINTQTNEAYTDMTVAPELLFVASAYDANYTGAADAGDYHVSLGVCADNSGAFDQWTRGRNVEDNRAAGPRIGSYTSAIATSRVTGAASVTGTDLGRLEITRMDTNAGKGRHSVTIRDAGGTAVAYAYMAVNFGGKVFYEVDVWQQDMTSTGNKSFSGASFTPDFLFAVQSYMNSADEAASKNINRGGSIGWGAIDSDNTTGDSYSGFTKRTTSNPSLAGSYYGSRIFAVRNHAGAVGWTADWVSFDSAGFTVNLTAAVGATKSIPILLTGTDIEATLGLIDIKLGVQAVTTVVPVTVALGLVEVKLGVQAVTTVVPVTVALGIVEVKLGVHPVTSVVPVTVSLGLVDVKLGVHPVTTVAPVTATLGIVDVDLGVHPITTVVPVTATLGLIDAKLGVHPVTVTVPGAGITVAVGQVDVDMGVHPVTTAVTASLGIVESKLGVHPMTTDAPMTVALAQVMVTMGVHPLTASVPGGVSVILSQLSCPVGVHPLTALAQVLNVEAPGFAHSSSALASGAASSARASGASSSAEVIGATSGA